MNTASMNAAKVTKLLRDWSGSAVLYRTHHVGPSGQRADQPVGRVRYCWDQAGWELEVSDPRTGEVVGYLSRDNWNRAGMWIVHSYCEDLSDWEFNRLLGWASSAAVGADVLVSGVHAAAGRHDAQRLSGSFTPYVPGDERRRAA
jgi:hypothetical protein